jgi:hypothetical protein
LVTLKLSDWSKCLFISHLLIGFQKMKRKNEEETTQESTNDNKKQKLAKKQLYVVTTSEYGMTGEEEEELADSKRFVQLFLEKNDDENDDENMDQMEERLILENADKINPLYWFANGKCEWGESENVFRDLGFAGIVEEQDKLVDLTYPNHNETVVISNGYLPKKEDTLFAYSEYTTTIKKTTTSASELFKLEIKKDAKNVGDLNKEIENTIRNSLHVDSANVAMVYLEVKDTSTAMDWYNYLKDVRLVEESLMKEKWAIMKEKGFCFDYPIQKNIE